MKKTVCSNLALSIWHDEKVVHARLENVFDMVVVEVEAEISVTTMISRAYHIKEALVLAQRRLVDAAFNNKMLDIDPTLIKAPIYHPIITKETDTEIDDRIE
jgi:hypothetical protein